MAMTYDNLNDSIPQYGPVRTDNWYTPRQPVQQNAGLMGAIKATIGEQYGLFNNPTARRLVGADNRMYVGKPGELGPEGNEVGNVYLGSADNWVFPQIQGIDGKLQFIPYDQLYTRDNEKRTDSQSFKMRTPEEAQYFGEHYKEVLHNPMFYNEYSPVKQYAEGGRIQSLDDRYNDIITHNINFTGDPSKVITFSNEDDYSIVNKANEIRQKVAEHYQPIYNKINESNEFAKGGKKKGGKSVFDSLMEKALSNPKWSKYNNKETRAFLKAIASQESSFVSTAKSVAGALGYFQLMPYEGVGNLTDQQKASGNWDQFGLMLSHLDSNEREINRRFTKSDWNKVSKLGLNMYDLQAIAHFSGIGGLRRWLHRSTPNNLNGGAKDAYGMNQLGYLNKLRKGMQTYGALIPEKKKEEEEVQQQPQVQYKYPSLDNMLAELNSQYAQAYQPAATYGPQYATQQQSSSYRVAQLDNPYDAQYATDQQYSIGGILTNKYEDGGQQSQYNLYRNYNGYALDQPGLRTVNNQTIFDYNVPFGATKIAGIPSEEYIKENPRDKYFLRHNDETGQDEIYGVNPYTEPTIGSQHDIPLNDDNQSISIFPNNNYIEEYIKQYPMRNIMMSTWAPQDDGKLLINAVKDPNNYIKYNAHLDDPYTGYGNYYDGYDQEGQQPFINNTGLNRSLVDTYIQGNNIGTGLTPVDYIPLQDIIPWSKEIQQYGQDLKWYKGKFLPDTMYLSEYMEPQVNNLINTNQTLLAESGPKDYTFSRQNRDDVQDYRIRFSKGPDGKTYVTGSDVWDFNLKTGKKGFDYIGNKVLSFGKPFGLIQRVPVLYTPNDDDYSIENDYELQNLIDNQVK